MAISEVFAIITGSIFAISALIGVLRHTWHKDSPAYIVSFGWPIEKNHIALKNQAIELILSCQCGVNKHVTFISSEIVKKVTKKQKKSLNKPQ